VIPPVPYPELLRRAIAFLFALGALCLCLDALTRKVSQPTRWRGWELFLVLLFVLPFAAYWTISLVNPRFGEPRNFFYLLPLYLFVAFHGLNRAVGFLARREGAWISVAVSLGLVAWIALGGIADPSFRFAPERYAFLGIVEAAARISSTLVIVHSSRGPNLDSFRSMDYYKRLVGLPDRVQVISDLDGLSADPDEQKRAAELVAQAQRVESFHLLEYITRDPPASVGAIVTIRSLSFRVLDVRLLPGKKLPYYWRGSTAGYVDYTLSADLAPPK